MNFQSTKIKHVETFSKLGVKPFGEKKKKSELLLVGASRSHDFVSASDSSHQQAGKHDAHYLKAQSQQGEKKA